MREISIGLKTKVIIILFLNIALMSASCAADAQKERIKESYDIGKSGLNRITMLPHKIVSVAGDNSQYKLQSDKDGSSIYIMPIAKDTQIIELSIRSDIGEIRDLELKVVSGRGRTIKLEATKKLDFALEQKREIKKMIASMQKKERGGYRVRKLNRNIANNYNLKIMQKALYQYKDLRGAVLEVTPSRSSNKSMILPSDVNEEMFAKLFNGTVATKINKASSNKALIVFVVTSVEDKHRNKR